MWKFPATLLTYRCPCILQAVKEAEVSSLRKTGAKQYQGNILFTTYMEGEKTPLFIFRTYLSPSLNTQKREHVEDSVPLRLSMRNSFDCTLEENILQSVLHFQTLLDVHKCPNGDKMIQETKLRVRQNQFNEYNNIWPIITNTFLFS